MAIAITLLSVLMALVIYPTQNNLTGLSWRHTSLSMAEFLSNTSISKRQQEPSQFYNEIVDTSSENQYGDETVKGNPVMLKFVESNDFDSWQINNDTVMGGVSHSHLEQVHMESIAVFSGELSLQNNGGFASVEFNLARPVSRQISNHVPSIIRIKVRGDGKRYQLRLKTPGLNYGEAYVAEFATLDNQSSEHQFAARDFNVRFRGRDIPNAPTINLEQVQKVGVLIADKQQGLFRIGLNMIQFE